MVIFVKRHGRTASNGPKMRTTLFNVCVGTFVRITFPALGNILRNVDLGRKLIS